jgi:hypothetical protein
LPAAEFLEQGRGIVAAAVVHKKIPRLLEMVPAHVFRAEDLIQPGEKKRDDLRFIVDGYNDIDTDIKIGTNIEGDALRRDVLTLHYPAPDTISLMRTTRHTSFPVHHPGHPSAGRPLKAVMRDPSPPESGPSAL